jgi:hypothetical protein
MRLGLAAILGSLLLASGAQAAVTQRSHPGLTIFGVARLSSRSG